MYVLALQNVSKMDGTTTKCQNGAERGTTCKISSMFHAIFVPFRVVKYGRNAKNRGLTYNLLYRLGAGVTNCKFGIGFLKQIVSKKVCFAYNQVFKIGCFQGVSAWNRDGAG